jgi:hypothetical protein
MALFNVTNLSSEIRSSFLYESKSFESLDDYADRKLNEVANSFSSLKNYDIFLSHSVKDAPAILGLTRFLESQGFSVYVDWIVDKQLDRSNVTTSTADIIRKRLKSCKSFLMALTSNSTKSSWVQWELGLADGQKNGKVAIVPLARDNDTNPNFYKQEYLGLYPYLDYAGNSIYVNGNKYVGLKEWLNKSDPLKDLLYS